MPSRVGSLAIPLYHEHFLIGQSNATCLNDSLSRLKTLESTMAAKAPSARIHMSGGLTTRFFFNLKETRL